MVLKVVMVVKLEVAVWVVHLLVFQMMVYSLSIYGQTKQYALNSHDLVKG